jgi:hypothetical protein
MALQAVMQGGARQMRDRWLQNVKTVVERRQRIAPEGDDNHLFLRQ